MASHAHVEGCARLNIMRLNAARLNFYEPVTLAMIGGVDRSQHVRIEGASVEHVLNDAPDTASVRVHGFVPVAGQEFQLYAGDRSLARQLFGGRLLETTVLYESRPGNVAYDLQAIDPTWLLNRRRVLARYVGIGAMHILSDIVNRWAPTVRTDFTLGNPVVDEITFTNETVASAITAVCERVGAYWYLDYGGTLHVFYDEGTPAGAITDADARGSSAHSLSEDLSQVVTRIIARGGSGRVAVDVPAGAAEIPVQDDGWFSDAGGVAEVAAQRVTYTGVKGRGGTGGLVGVALGPTSPVHATPMASNNLAGSLPSGVYQYALTFANATGETLPGPPVSVTLGGTAPTLPQTSMRPGYYGDYQGKTTGGSYAWRIALAYEGGGYALGPPTPYYTVNDRRYEMWVGGIAYDPVSQHPYYTALMAGTPARVETTTIYRTVNGGATWYREQFWGGVVSTAAGWLDPSNQLTDAELVLEPPYPTGPIATFNAVRVAGFQTRPSAFTTTKLYRTAVGSAQLKLRATNPADPLWDYAADATLGANAPTSDTSGVTAPVEIPIVTAGAAVIPVTNVGPFAADGGTAGGWASIGSLAIRYTGISGATLTGVPAAGDGALTTEVRHGAQIVVLARLVGVAGLTAALKTGDAATIRLELDDPAAQAALGARLGLTAADGLVEEVFSDSRMTLIELGQYARALLTERKDPRRTLRFVTRDESVQVGRLITVDLASPPISGTFRVQRIAFDEIAITGGLARVKPRRTVEASNKLYTLVDLWRRLRGREGGAS